MAEYVPDVRALPRFHLWTLGCQMNRSDSEEMAGRLLRAGCEEAGSLETDKLRATLAKLQTDTPLGAYRVAANGEQLGIVPAVAQIQRGKPQVIWPAELQTGAPLQTYLPWKERQLIQ